MRPRSCRSITPTARTPGSTSSCRLPWRRLLCNGDCIVTKNFSLLEPDVFERKYYAPGIGVFLEVEPEAGEVVRLVKCNVDPRCALLPQ